MIDILIVDDEINIANELAIMFNDYGISTKYLKKFDNVITDFKDYDPQVILLDINLPNQNGIFLAQQIRKFSNIPIIFISAIDDRFSKLKAYSFGGDDYITKPIDADLLLIKIQNLLARLNNTKENYNLTYHFLTLDCNLLRLINTKNNKTVSLSKNEFNILKLLFTNKNQVISRERFMEFLWNNDSYVDDNTLTVNINRVRKKLLQLTNEVSIETKKGIGYFLQ